jgi:putative membrane protein
MKCKFATLTIASAVAGFFIGSSLVRAQEQANQPSQPSETTMQENAQPGSQMSEAREEMLQKVAENPKEFIQRAYQNNQTEIQLGQLAEQKGQSQSVKDFGKNLVKSHQSLNDKLTKLASDKNIELSTTLDTRHQMVIDRLSSFSGADFDKRFTNEQVMSHKRDVALYEQVASKCPDADVKSFAESSLPSLRENLQMAQTQATTIREAAGAEQKSSPQEQPK